MVLLRGYRALDPQLPLGRHFLLPPLHLRRFRQQSARTWQHLIESPRYLRKKPWNRSIRTVELNGRPIQISLSLLQPCYIVIGGIGHEHLLYCFVLKKGIFEVAFGHHVLNAQNAEVSV